MIRLSLALVGLALPINSIAHAETAFQIVEGAPPAVELEVPVADQERVYLYGGPGTLEGKFQNASGAPDWQGWTSVDMTQAAYEQWQVSTFNAETLGGHGVGNHAMWCGADDPAFATAPGYGSNWDAILEWRSGQLADPSVGQTVGLEFLFHYDVEPGFDFFEVQFLRAGEWITTASRDGTDGPGGIFAAPGTSYTAVATAPITYEGNDYPDDEIVLRLRFRSDPVYDDEDGMWDTTAGAVQVDDIRVNWTDGVARESFTDFESAGPYPWVWIDEFAGDFTKIIGGLSDLDPCRENRTPQMTFIDDGRSPRNAPGQSTGGYVDGSISYGVPPFGFPWSGGLTKDLPAPVGTDCRPVSPVIAIDLPGTGDDGPGWRVHIAYETHYYSTAVSPHLFLDARASEDGGSSWTPWSTVNDFVYSAPSGPGYWDVDFDVHQILPVAATHLQLRFHVYDYLGSPYGIPTGVAGPWFDNVEVYKVRTADEPSVTTYNRLVSSFPLDPEFDVTTVPGRDALDVPLNILWAGRVDEVRVDVLPWDAAAPPAPEDVRLVWVLDRNPVFEDAIRSLPPGAVNVAGAGRRGWDQWRGSFGSSQLGSWPTRMTFAVDPPDVDFVYPGDEFRWYVEVTSADGIVSSDPTDLAGFEDGIGYDHGYTMRAFPSVTDPGGTIPSALAVDYGYRPTPDDRSLELALESLGLRVGTDVDVMVLAGGALADSMAIGPSLAQAEGYETILVLEPGLDDDADEIVPFLIDWQDLPGDRTVILFDGLRFGTEATVGTEFWSRMGVARDLGVDPVELVGTERPYVVPAIPGFDEVVFHSAWCTGRPLFSFAASLMPVPPAIVGHVFSAQPDGSGPTMNASVINTWASGGTKTVISLPLYFRALGAPVARDVGLLEEARLLQDLFEYSGVVAGGGSTDAPDLRVSGITQLRAHPNPFNPATTIGFRLGESGRTRVDIFDVSGRRVRSLFDGSLSSGLQGVNWDGHSDDQARVASGVYFVRIQQAGHHATMKIALVE